MQTLDEYLYTIGRQYAASMYTEDLTCLRTAIVALCRETMRERRLPGRLRYRQAKRLILAHCVPAGAQTMPAQG